MNLRVAIVDDEPLARAGLKLRLERAPGVEIVGEAGNAAQAVVLVESQHPDVLLLDIEMPGVDGFQLLEQLAGAGLPQVIFVTAHERHAVRAFEVCALDYLLKPVEDVRLREALRKARERQAQEGNAQRVERLAQWMAERAHHGTEPLTRFVVQDRGRVHLLPAESIRWIASAANYVELHTATASYLVRMTLEQAAARLPDFIRIHRRRLVRAALIRTIEPSENGDFRVRLDGGECLVMSRRYRHAGLRVDRAGPP